MAGSNTVRLSFVGDSSSLDKAGQDVQNTLQATSREIARAAEHQELLGENLEGTAKHGRGAADALDGLSAATGAFGLTLPGPIGGAIQLSRGFADLADGAATTLVPALRGLRTAMLATLGPWGLAAVAVAALVAGFILAYKHSEKFRDVVQAVGGAAKDAFEGIATVAGDVFGGLESGFKGVEKASEKVAGALLAPYRLAFDGIAEAWNHTIGGLHVHIPGVHLPSFMGGGGFDGVDFGIPSIPTFAAGGVMGSTGLALVGENGPELVGLPGGARVFTNSQSAAMMSGRGGGSSNVTLTVVGNTNDVLVQMLRKHIRVTGGGNVQLALGR